MNVITKIGSGRTIHAASYSKETGEIKLYCGALKYDQYFADITDYTAPTTNNVTCRKCSRKGGF